MDIEEYFTYGDGAMTTSYEQPVEDLDVLLNGSTAAGPYTPQRVGGGGGDALDISTSGGMGGVSAAAASSVAAVAKKEPETPMFQLSRVEYQPNHIVHMVVASNIVVLALANNHVIRLNLRSPADIEDIEITRRADDSIHRVFLDPTGNHLLVTTRTEENYYMHSSFRKPRQISKMRGTVVESVAWDMQNRDGQTTTGTILIGTTQGKIYEASFENIPERRLADLVGVGAKEQVFKLLFTLEGSQPVTGLRFERFPPSRDMKVNFVVMATTPTRLYQFIGGPTFEAAMAYYEQAPSYQEIPPGDNKRSELAFFSRPGGSAQTLAWLTGPGVYHGKLVYGTQEPGDTVAPDCHILNYPDPSDPPISIVVSEFHYILLHERKLQCISTLNELPVFEQELPNRFGPVRGLAHDTQAGTIWVYCDLAIFELVVTAEDRDVWKLYMSLKDWSTAIEFCKDDRRKKNEVWTAQAASYFADRKYELAASYYAKTHVPLEEVALMFINADRRDALKLYLVQKLDTVPRDAVTQVMVIATWLVEIFLNKLNLLSDAAAAAPASKKSDAVEQCRMCEEEFHTFLTQYREKLNPATTFNLISSHGRVSDLLFFASLIGDHERVISHHMREHNFAKAIETLSGLGKGSVDLFYKFSPELMTVLPEETVGLWTSVDFLQPKRLFPALMRYEDTMGIRAQAKSGAADASQEDHAVKYLQWCVEHGNTEAAVHNFLLSLHAQKSAVSGDDGPLLAFIENASGPVYYDLKYALRLCTKLSKPQACILIYSKMGLYEEAVDLALSVDINLAKSNANKPEDEQMRRRLWLKIAQRVVRERNDIREAVQFLQSCELLKIEDILPFFSDFTRIDDFKDEICRSLEEYNAHIGQLRDEMAGATKSATTIRKDIADLRSRFSVVPAGRTCDVCHHLALSRQFYLFPCKHVFHADCLVSTLAPMLPIERRSHMLDLHAQVGLACAEGAGASASQSAHLDTLRGQLDAYVAAECPFCGELQITQIDLPFVTHDDPAISQWALPSYLP